MQEWKQIVHPPAYTLKHGQVPIEPGTNLAMDGKNRLLSHYLKLFKEAELRDQISAESQRPLRASVI